MRACCSRLSSAPIIISFFIIFIIALIFLLSLPTLETFNVKAYTCDCSGATDDYPYGIPSGEGYTNYGFACSCSPGDGGGGGGPAPCSNAAVCQAGDPWDSANHSPGCLCGPCIPWQWGSACGCYHAPLPAPTLLTPPNGDQNQVPSYVHLSWNPISTWGYESCPFTPVKRYYVYVTDQTMWWVAALEDGRSISCINENDRSNPGLTTPTTYCDLPVTPSWCIDATCKSFTLFPFMGPLTPGHTYRWAVRAENFFGPGPLSDSWTFTVASCSMSLQPTNGTVALGGSQDIVASVTPVSGVSVDWVGFTSGDESTVKLNQGRDNNAPYNTTAKGLKEGTTTVSAYAIVNSGGVGCTATTNLTVLKPAAWWQVKDADVISGGSLNSSIPGSCTSPGCDPNFDLPGGGGFPGVPTYVGSYDFSAESASKGLVSTPQGWLANSPTNFKKVYDYTFFKRQIPSDVTSNIVEITTPSVNGGYFSSGGSPARGYVWYHFDGSQYGDLTINGNVNLPGNRKVVLLAEGANVNIIGKVNIQSRGNGFIMILAGKAADGSKGNITIDPSVSSPSSPALEGIFFADNKFSTGAGTNWLWVHGTIAALGGINLQRDLTDNSSQPAEFFEYAPELMTLYPNVFTNRKIRWKEVAP